MATSQSAAELIGLAGVTLVFARAGYALGTGRRRTLFAALAAGLAVVPWGGLPIAGYLRGVTGDLSVTTLVLLSMGFTGGLERTERLAVSLFVVTAALFLYPMALGLGPFDPYRLGFSPRGLLVVLFGVAVFASLRDLYVLVLCVGGAVLAHALGLLESSNLWDYLVDPWVFVAAIYELWSVRRIS